MMLVSVSLDNLLMPAAPQQPVPPAGAFAQLVAAEMPVSEHQQPGWPLGPNGRAMVPPTGTQDPQGNASETASALPMLWAAIMPPAEQPALSPNPVASEAPASPADPTTSLPNGASPLPPPQTEPALDLPIGRSLEPTADAGIPADSARPTDQRPAAAGQDIKPPAAVTALDLITASLSDPLPPTEVDAVTRPIPVARDTAEPAPPPPTVSDRVQFATVADGAALLVRPATTNPQRQAARGNPSDGSAIERAPGVADMAGAEPVAEPLKPTGTWQATPAAAVPAVATAAVARSALLAVEPQLDQAAADPDADSGLRLARSMTGDAIDDAPATGPKAASPAFSSYLQALPNTVTALGLQIAHARLEGVERLQVRLSPEELGSVDITISVDEGKTARVAIVVERPETLELLARDARQLERILHAQGLDLGGELHLGLREEHAGGEHSRPDRSPANRNLNTTEMTEGDALAPVRLAADGLLDLLI